MCVYQPRPAMHPEVLLRVSRPTGQGQVVVGRGSPYLAAGSAWFRLQSAGQHAWASRAWSMGAKWPADLEKALKQNKSQPFAKVLLPAAC